MTTYTQIRLITKFLFFLLIWWPIFIVVSPGFIILSFIFEDDIEGFKGTMKALFFLEH